MGQSLWNSIIINNYLFFCLNLLSRQFVFALNIVHIQHEICYLLPLFNCSLILVKEILIVLVAGFLLQIIQLQILAYDIVYVLRKRQIQIQRFRLQILKVLRSIFESIFNLYYLTELILRLMNQLQAIEFAHELYSQVSVRNCRFMANAIWLEVVLGRFGVILEHFFQAYDLVSLAQRFQWLGGAYLKRALLSRITRQNGHKRHSQEHLLLIRGKGSSE